MRSVFVSQRRATNRADWDDFSGFSSRGKVETKVSVGTM